jgi:hypothetical protein
MTLWGDAPLVEVTILGAGPSVQMTFWGAGPSVGMTFLVARVFGRDDILECARFFHRDDNFGGYAFGDDGGVVAHLVVMMFLGGQALGLDGNLSGCAFRGDDGLGDCGFWW